MSLAARRVTAPARTPEEICDPNATYGVANGTYGVASSPSGDCDWVFGIIADDRCGCRSKSRDIRVLG